MSINHKLFEVKKAHIALITNLLTKPEKLSLIGSQSTQSPFSEEGKLIDDLALIIVGKELTDEEKAEKLANEEHFYTKDNEEELLEIYKGLPTALEIVLNTQKFKPGIYRTRHYLIDWKLIG